MNNWTLRQIGIITGSIIGHFITNNSIIEVIINILIVTYFYSIYDAIKAKKNHP